MNAEIVAVGTELLLGQICNTNAQFLSRKLAEWGVDVYVHTAVGDNAARLRACLEIASRRADIVILTGGLGPTPDDLTKETVAAFLGLPLEVHGPSLARIEAFFRQRGLLMTENNRKQALVLKGATVLPNETGLAPGMAVQAEGKLYVLLPGPPRELVPMVERHLRPVLEAFAPMGAVVHSEVLRFFGIGEAALAEQIADLLDAQTNPTVAPLVEDGEVTLRLTAKAPSREEARALIGPVKAAILARIGRYYYGSDDDRLPVVVVRRLADRGLRLAVAESCTGGRIAELITGVPGASRVFAGGIVAYTLEAKRNLVGVSGETLAAYGTISPACAREMAAGVRRALQADVGLAVTGVAGPDPAEGKPVGEVHLGLALPDGTVQTERLQLAGDREAIRLRAAKHALFWLWRVLGDRCPPQAKQDCE
ncbi:MAG: competence/damage-inducible protein A [Bacillota bacterium]|nr:competence/damage-inducible protein A [Bacillota bacterium]